MLKLSEIIQNKWVLHVLSQHNSPNSSYPEIVHYYSCTQTHLEHLSDPL